MTERAGMLVLTRRSGQFIFIDHPDGPIRVRVLSIEEDGRDRVRLGIAAPRSVNIRRGELEKT